MSARLSCYLSLVVLCFCAGCANITSPTGGKKDIIPPKMVSIDPADSQLSTRVTRLEMHFDEYVTVSDGGKDVQLSPILSVPPTVISKNKTVIVKIVDSLLEANTTYRLSFGTSIRDLHEGNPFHKYTYTFSTGAYFDSLQLHGNVINAETGMPDTGSILMELYNASENDSAVVRHKPRYVTKTDASGNFTFKGLPKRRFRLYAVKDVNTNLLYDGPVAGELVGFADSVVVPSDTSQLPVNFRIFAEIPDTATKKSLDSVANKKEPKKTSKQTASDALTYTVNIDTSTIDKRTFDITSFITISFNKLPILNTGKITLTYDSLGNTVTPAYSVLLDSVTHKVKINTDWRGDMLYKLRLVKGFAKDTSGVEVVPSKYVFRTRQEDDDYGKITLHLPAKYLGSGYLLRVLADNDSVYQQPVKDTMVVLTRLKPAKYTFRIIVDKNHNGKWDTGDLLAKKQPEEVIPYKDQVPVKAGFENTTDFEQTPAPKKVKDKDGAKPR